MTSRGFTLIELLITMVVMALLGTALARILINNTRFVSQQDAMMEARESARAAMNVVSPELRVISDGGLVAAHRDSIRARIPYAFGMICDRVLSTTVASVMPTDSAMYAAATAEGLAWRTSAGTYTVISGITVAPSVNTLVCTVDSVRVLSGGRLVDISGIPAAQKPDSGSIFYLFQTVTYKFATSTDLPGRRGLWRKAGAAAYEELVAPFDTTARFAFLMGPDMRVDTRPNFTSQAARDSVRGLELWLIGASEYVPQGSTGYQKFDLRTSVPFLNRTN